ncbi:hypothetical protein P4S55_16110 [Shewanella sp. PP-Sp27a-2]
MTTTVYDLINKTVASDTRWSAQLTLSDGNNYIVYVDDSDFEKIADRESAVLVLAGLGTLIAQWKEWWYNSLDENCCPPVEDASGNTAVSLMIIDKSSGQIIFDAGQKKAMFCKFTSNMLSVFAGSGDIHAASCWHNNRCAKTAITSASNLDFFTSPIVRFVDFASGQTNLTSMCYNYKEIMDAMLRGGFVMDMSKSPAANDEGVPLNQTQVHNEIVSLIASGKVVASAPVQD